MQARPDRAAKETLTHLPDTRELTISERVSSPGELRQRLQRNALSTAKLGVRLIELGLVTRQEINRALAIQAQEPQRHLGEILLEIGAISRSHLQQVLCEKLGIPLVDLSGFPIDGSVLDTVPPALARESGVLPLCRVDGKLVVAVADPLDTEPLERVRFCAQSPVLPVLAPRSQIEQAISRQYGAQAPLAGSEPGSDAGAAADITIVALVNRVLADACAQGASHVHIDASCGADEFVVRMRRDGHLSQHMRLPLALRRRVVERIAEMAGIDTLPSGRTFEGRIDMGRYGHDSLQVRVLALPAAPHSHDLALRIESTEALLPLPDLGMTDAVRNGIGQLLANPRGLLLVAAPPRMGKSASARAILRLVENADVKVWTIERHPLSHSRTDTGNGHRPDYDYAAHVRTAADADPDVLMIDEIVDADTAATAVEAALRGSRVIATLRAGNAAQAIERLLDFGIDAFSVGEALLGVLGERVARRLCSNCRTRSVLSAAESESLLAEYCHGTQINPGYVRAGWAAQYGSELAGYRAPGCAACRGTGCYGHVGLFELLTLGPITQRVLTSRKSSAELAMAAVRGGMRTIRQDGIDKALAGVCSLREIRAATI